MNTILLLSLSAVLLLNVLCQNCDDTAKPNTLSDCEKLITKEGGTCCFAQSPGFYAFEKKCVEIDEYREQREWWDGMERWRLECPSKGYEKKKYQLCGADYPMDAIDCWKYSTPKQSCCYTNKTEPWYYGNKSDQLIKNVTPECRWYKKDQGNFTSEDDKNIEQLYQCSCSFFSISFPFFGLLSLLLI